MLSVSIAQRPAEAAMEKGDSRRGYAGSAYGVCRAAAIRYCGLSRLCEALSEVYAAKTRKGSEYLSNGVFQQTLRFFVCGASFRKESMK